MMRFNAILFNIVEACNIRCRHCGYANSTRKGLLKGEDLVDWVAQAVEYGIQHVIFSGGEPFTAFDLLKQGVEAVHRSGGESGVFTNSFWGKTVEAARETLEQLPGLTHLYLSCDVYHLEFVSAQNILNIIRAARQLSIPTVVICITYVSDIDKHRITEMFAAEGDYINFHYGRVIPSDYVQKFVPEAYDCMHEFVPDNFSRHCFLHTPLVHTSGNVWACHIGTVETHSDFSLSPYYLGDLKREKLKDIFERAEHNALYQYLRVCGPKAVVEAALSSPAGEELKKQRFSCDCHMCYEVLPRKEVLAEVQKRACDDRVKNSVFLKRVLTLGDDL